MIWNVFIISSILFTYSLSPAWSCPTTFQPPHPIIGCCMVCCEGVRSKNGFWWSLLHEIITLELWANNPSFNSACELKREKNKQNWQRCFHIDKVPDIQAHSLGMTTNGSKKAHQKMTPRENIQTLCIHPQVTTKYPWNRWHQELPLSLVSVPSKAFLSSLGLRIRLGSWKWFSISRPSGWTGWSHLSSKMPSFEKGEKCLL